MDSILTVLLLVSEFAGYFFPSGTKHTITVSARAITACIFETRRFLGQASNSAATSAKQFSRWLYRSRVEDRSGRVLGARNPNTRTCPVMKDRARSLPLANTP